MKTIKFDKQLNLYIIENTDIGAIISFTPEEFSQMLFDASVEREVADVLQN